MLEDYYVKPATVDRVRASWLAPQMESYLTWNGWKHTATLASSYIAGCRCFFILLSSQRKRGQGQSLLLAGEVLSRA
jgi:hypothetical protein